MAALADADGLGSAKALPMRRWSYLTHGCAFIVGAALSGLLTGLIMAAYSNGEVKANEMSNMLGLRAVFMQPITQMEVNAAEQSWFAAFLNCTDQASVEQFVSDHYAYNTGPVLFKPTTAPVALTYDANVAYFTASAPLLALVQNISYVNKGVISDQLGQMYVYGQWTMQFKMSPLPTPVMDKLAAMKMLLNADGKSVTFDFTMGFTRTHAGAVKIFLHHNVWRASPA